MTTAVRAGTAFLACIVFLGLTGIVGCPFSPEDKDDIVVPPPKFKSRISPENLLENLKTAYREREVAEYESLLANNFTFVLSLEDQDEPDMPDQWGRNTEIEIHRNIFDNENVHTLTLEFVPGSQEWEPIENMWSILVTNIDLTLTGVVPGQEELGQQTLTVDDATSRFWFAEAGPATGNATSWTEPGTQNKIWKIVKWQDHPQY